MKRFLSLILALALICTMLPTVFAAEEGETETGARNSYKYNFGYEAYGAENNIQMKTNFTQDTAAEGEEGYVADTVSIARYALDKKLATVNTSPWFFAGMKYVNDSLIKSGELWIQAFRTRAGQASHGFMIAIDVPAAGEYIPTLNYQAVERGYINNILLVPEDDARLIERTSTRGGIGFWRVDNTTCEGTDGVSSYISNLRDIDRENHQIGTIDMQETVPDEEIETKTFDSVTLEKKRYYLVFDAEGQTVDSENTLKLGNKIELSLRSFELNPPALKTVDVSFGSDTIYVKEATKTKLTLKYDTGKEYTEEYTAAYESMNDSATIDSNGIVTGLREGNAKIKVTVTPKNYGDPISVEATIPVVKRNAGEAIKYSFGYEGYGMDVDIPISTSYVKDTAAVGSADYVENTISLARFDTDEKWANIGTAPWRVDGMRYVRDMKAQSGSLWINSWQNRTGITTHGVFILIDVSKAGEYTPVLEYQSLIKSYINDVYLIPADDTDVIADTSKITFYRGDNQSLEGDGVGINYINNMTAENREKYRIGTVDMQETATTEDNESEYARLKAMELEEKQYYLVFHTKGQTTDTASLENKVNIILRSLELVPLTASEKVEHQFDYTEEKHIGGDASVKAYAVYGTDGEVSETELIETPDVTYGETCEVTAPEAPEGYSFLYWAKGATMEKKQIVSYSQSFDYLPSEGANYLIAVYKKDSAEAVTKNEYYNANGQLLTDATLPSMAGYGKATGWKEYGNGVFVAQYDDLKSDIPVTVDGKTDYYAYGDTVNCVASAPEGKKFMYWVKDNEIVSVSPTYSFSAWKKSTVEAVYGDEDLSFSKSMRKIVLGTFASGDYNAVMAEFIGFSDALEKGIMFGNRKIPMKSNKTQFTLTNDLEDVSEIKGYAIVKAGNELKLICDGSISVGE